MSEKIFNISIAGCGKVAHLHARAIKDISGARLTGVWSRTAETARTFAEEYGTTAFSSVSRMVAENKTDLVIVCTPHPFHRHPAVEAAEAGANVLVEKPLASCLSDCDAIIDSCKSNKVNLGVISQRRWYPPVARVKEAIDRGGIGKPVMATVTLLGWRDKGYYDADAWRGTWNMEGGGVLVNQSPHQLDIMLWYMGEIEEVYGLWKNLNHPYIEVEDTAVAIVRFRNGGIGNILVSNSQKPGIYGKVQIHGDNGSSVGVQTDGGAMFIAGMTGVAEPPYNDLWTIPGEEHLAEKWKKEDSDAFSRIDPTVFFMKCQIEDYLDALKNNRLPAVTGDDGRRVVELFSAIYRSTRDNAPVKFPLKRESGFDGRPMTTPVTGNR